MALTDKLTAIADAIRSKTGGTEGLTLVDMVSAIEGITGGGGNGGDSPGFFGMLNDMWAYGTFDTTEILTVRQQPFYWSIPEFTEAVLLYKSKPNDGSSGTSRPTYFGSLVMFSSKASAIERYGIPPVQVEGYENVYYPSSANNYGVSNGQKVQHMNVPNQLVGCPVHGYDMTLMLFKPKASAYVDAPQYYADKIHLTSLEANTWVTIPGTEQKIYFGFVAPELDAQEG